VLLFTLFGVIVLAVVGPSPRGSDYEETRARKRVEQLKKLREDTEKELTTYAWVDKNKGVARIPINRAMELTLADLAQKKPAPAGAIATPAAPSPAAPASPTASPAPGGSPKTVGAQPSPQAGGPVASPAPQAAASSSPAAQQSSPAPASPTPPKSP
jgi:hypothetical protein